ncbi:MAG: ABC transporter ATP-binding protein [Synergistaceae bacterium]|nr:ABC transporter ATP-binding protein [Synergistaceae bacterium]MBR1603515.1 ABC transporter ATP-binding protein [Synergistaceae bacterium]
MLKIKNLYYSYPDGHAALNGVNLELKRGERLALVGANGSGKSTLLLHIAGALAAQRGEIILNNKLINANNINLLREAAGLIFQEPDDQLFMPSVLEDLCFGLIANNIDAKVAKSRAVEMLNNLNIAHLAERPPHKLSGGEKRMAALAGILVMNPEILILDEPSAALDPKARRTVINTLNNLTHQAILLATHDLDMALDVCERAIILNNGQVAASGKLPELLQDESLLIQNGLELPLRYFNHQR